MTAKQAAYLKDLLSEAGHYDPAHNYMLASSKGLPHSPSMRERAKASLWFQRLSVRQASEIIDDLLNG